MKQKPLFNSFVIGVVVFFTVALALTKCAFSLAEDLKKEAVELNIKKDESK